MSSNLISEQYSISTEGKKFGLFYFIIQKMKKVKTLKMNTLHYLKRCLEYFKQEQQIVWKMKSFVKSLWFTKHQQLKYSQNMRVMKERYTEVKKNGRQYLLQLQIKCKALSILLHLKIINNLQNKIHRKIKFYCFQKENLNLHYLKVFQKCTKINFYLEK